MKASSRKVTLKQAVDFHGHLGPYLVLGLMAGELALRKLKSDKYFGLQVKVKGADKKPKSCLIDGLQLSTGATLGKGNISKNKGQGVKITISNSSSKINIAFRKHLIKTLDKLKTHRDSEAFASKIYRVNPSRLFIVVKS